MPIYEVTEVGSGGGGCIGPLLALGLCVIAVSALADSCGSPSGRTGSVPSPRETTEPGGSGGPLGTGPTKDGKQQPEQDIWHLFFVNGWVLERLYEERRPVALIAVPEASSLEESLVEALQRRGVSAHGDVFTREAYQSGELLKRLEGGDDIVLRDLRLARLSGHLVLGRLSFSELRELRNGFRTRARLSVTLVPLAGGQPAEQAFEARGSGFEADEAREQALGRVQSDFLQSSLADRLTPR